MRDSLKIRRIMEGMSFKRIICCIRRTRTCSMMYTKGNNSSHRVGSNSCWNNWTSNRNYFFINNSSYYNSNSRISSLKTSLPSPPSPHSRLLTSSKFLPFKCPLKLVQRPSPFNTLNLQIRSHSFPLSQGLKTSIILTPVRSKALKRKETFFQSKWQIKMMMMMIKVTTLQTMSSNSRVLPSQTATKWWPEDKPSKQSQ